MISVKGKYNEAIVYASTIEEQALEQIRSICDLEVYKDNRIRIMPDVHSGKGCTIGTTMTVKDAVTPNLVGVDIGCGMYTVELGQVEIDLEEFDKIVHTIPCGREVWDGRIEKFDLSRLRCFRNLKDTRRLVRSLGTLGGGNHFIELDKDEENNIYLVIHSGSRNLGLQVANYYQNLAIDLNKGLGEYFEARDNLIRTYKEQGRRNEIEKALSELKKTKYEQKETSIPGDLCYLSGRYLEDYLYDIDICQEFAKRNRELMAKVILDKAGLKATDSFQTIHNYIDVKEMILRKGSVSAKDGEKILIPINMRDGSLICVGKGNPEWNCSAPHGAGRIMSRTQAANELSLEEFRKQMDGIYSSTININTLDESPMAYKDMKDIVDNIEPTATIIKTIKPIYNFKADN